MQLNNITQNSELTMPYQIKMQNWNFEDLIIYLMGIIGVMAAISSIISTIVMWGQIWTKNRISALCFININIASIMLIIFSEVFTIIKSYQNGWTFGIYLCKFYTFSRISLLNSGMHMFLWYCLIKILIHECEQFKKKFFKFYSPFYYSLSFWILNCLMHLFYIFTVGVVENDCTFIVKPKLFCLFYCCLFVMFSFGSFFFINANCLALSKPKFERLLINNQKLIFNNLTIDVLTWIIIFMCNSPYMIYYTAFYTVKKTNASMILLCIVFLQPILLLIMYMTHKDHAVELQNLMTLTPGDEYLISKNTIIISC
ncbi:hypothetical protein A3Q56_00398 [Intoshia linei]|uniref:Uncharacterized protein n=1 Tax=Intoshia linei TaxID=1819745 RepID=A0A177BBZ0_9BILA|nr:hypothetical protein A3Q56_00398 [Intoshia linei]